MASAVADLVAAEGEERALAMADALERGEIGLTSTVSAIQACMSIPQHRLRPFRDALLAAADVQQLVMALRVAGATSERVSAAKPNIEVAWTYPRNTRPGVRTTGGVAREIIERSSLTLLVVGYSVTVDPALTGLAAQTVAAIARAAERGVAVTAVLHRAANREALLQAWRSGVRPPALFTWPAAEDEMSAVHAKLLVADRRDGLVTSANLTYHGLERNLEMGVRVSGVTAAEIHDRIHDLIAIGDLVPWEI